MTELLERENELALLATLCADSTSEGRAIAFRGAAGIGKTSLLQAARERARSSGFTVLTARGSELEQDLGFGLVRQLFEPIILRASDAEMAGLFAGTAALARGVFEPEMVTSAGNGSAIHAPLYGLYWLVANMTRSAPVALVLDDLQWADAASLRFVHFLLRRLQSLPILIVVAWRPSAPSDLDDLLTPLESDPDVVLVEPRPLSPLGVSALVPTYIAEATPPSLAAECYQLTGGNPFLVVSVLKQLSNSGTVDIGALSWTGPEPLVRSVLAVLSSLGRDESSLAEAIAVLGDSCTLALAARLTGLSLPRATAAFGVLKAASILEDNTTPDFVHPLLRAVAYQHLQVLPGSDRHARAAAALRADGAPLEQVALQLLLSRPDGSQEVCELLVAAASQAMERGAPDSAAAYLRRALEEPVADDRRPSVLLTLGVAEIRAGVPAALGHLDEARRQGASGATRLQATVVQARALYSVGAPKQAVELLRAELADADPGDIDVTARLVDELRTLGDVDLTVRRLVYEDAPLGLASPSEVASDHRGLAHNAIALLVRGDSAVTAGMFADRALAGGELEADALAGGPLLFMTAFAATCADSFSQPQLALRRVLAAAQEKGDALTFCLAAIQRGFLAVRSGDLRLAEADARSALEAVNLNGWLPLAQMALTVLSYVAVEVPSQGTGAESEFFDPDQLDGELTTQGAVLLEARGQMRLARGDYEGALADLSRVGRDLNRWGVVNPGPFPWRSSAGLAASRLGHASDARELVQEELTLGQAWGAPRTVSIALRAMAKLSSRDEHLDLLEEAVSVSEGSPALLEKAYALVDFGAALRRVNKRTQARVMLTEGLSLADRCHATVLAKRAHTELWATGARPRTALRVGVDALTASERRIADMVGQGLSNPEIAQALFISTKTVEMHLTAAFRKLQVATRIELARLLAAIDDEGPPA